MRVSSPSYYSPWKFSYVHLISTRNHTSLCSAIEKRFQLRRDYKRTLKWVKTSPCIKSPKTYLKIIVSLSSFWRIWIFDLLYTLLSSVPNEFPLFSSNLNVLNTGNVIEQNKKSIFYKTCKRGYRIQIFYSQLKLYF